MAKTKAKTPVKKAAKRAETETLKATALLRKGALAYVGLYGAAYERAKLRVAQVRSATDGLFDELVQKGEIIENKAVVIAKGAQLKAQETAQDTAAKVRGVLPTASNDRVEELEAEVAKLNRKLATLSKKAAKPVKKASMKTEKTIKKAPAAKAAQKAA